MSAPKRKGMSLGVKRRTEVPEISEEAVEAFAAGAETERQKAARTSREKLPKRAVVDETEQPLVKRDSFTMPEDDYALIADVRERCLRKGLPMTKGEVLRAGLHALATMSDSELHVLASRVEKIKTGRPKQ